MKPNAHGNTNTDIQSFLQPLRSLLDGEYNTTCVFDNQKPVGSISETRPISAEDACFMAIHASQGNYDCYPYSSVTDFLEIIEKINIGRAFGIT